MTKPQILETARIPNSNGDTLVIYLAPSAEWGGEFMKLVKVVKPTLRIGETKPTLDQVAAAGKAMVDLLTQQDLSLDVRPMGSTLLENYRARKLFGDMKVTRYIELKKLAEAGLLLRAIKPLEEVT